MAASDLARLESWFASGSLVQPDYDQPSTVSLARALAGLCGADLDPDPRSGRLAALIGEAEHYVFVLADGLGLDLVEEMPRGSFLRSRMVRELRSVFPSSTAPALTSLATGVWPADHGVATWFQYLAECDLQATVLPFVERFSRRDLASLGVDSAEVFAVPPLAPRLGRSALTFMPMAIADSVYTSYCRGGTPVTGYRSLPEAMDAVGTRVLQARGESFTYVYYPEVDSLTHVHGPLASQVAAKVVRLDDELQRLHGELKGRARLVVSADHGAIAFREDAKLRLSRDDALLQTLLTVPSGEPRVPLFHARQGAHEAFAGAFRREYGDRMALLTLQQVDDLRLLGPGPLSARARARLGDFIALSADGSGLILTEEQSLAVMRGVHGGLSAAEVRVPLIVA
jgi:hypothetical protein